MTYDTVPSSIQDRPPVDITTAVALPLGTLPERDGVRVATLNRLQLSAAPRLGFRFHWLREEAPGRIAGCLGLAIATPIAAGIGITVEGEFSAMLSLDAGAWLRLRIIERAAGTTGAMRVTAAIAVPEKPEELAAAILGIHHTEWLKDLARIARTGCSFDLPEGIAPTELAGWFKTWERLDASVREAIWRAAGSAEPDSADRPLEDREFAATLTALKQYAGERLGIDCATNGLRDSRAFAGLDNWLKVRLFEALGGLETPADFARASRSLDAVLAFVQSVYERAAGALESRYATALTWKRDESGTGPALIDCSFAFTPEGLAAYHKAVTGDFCGLLAVSPEHARLNEARLTDGHPLERLDANVDLRMPLFDRKQWNERWKILPQMQLTGAEDGSLVAYRREDEDANGSRFQTDTALALAGALFEPAGPGFTLTAADCRTIGLPQANMALGPILSAYGFSEDVPRWIASAASAGADRENGLEASLTLSLPGCCAAEWLAAPRERDPNFFDVYSEVSVAVQRALRLWVPYAYFSDIGKYEEAHAAYALVLYTSLRPFSGRPRSDFTYEVLAPDSPEWTKRTTLRNFIVELQRVEALLNLLGKPKAARCYAPRYAQDILAIVRRQPRLLNSLLMNDAFFVDSFVRLGVTAHDIGEAFASDRQKALRDLAKLCGELTVAFDRKLRRLYGSQSFPGLGSLLLIEATRALVASGNPDVPIAAAIRLAAGGDGGARRRERMFANAALGSW
jgi:hypothetical protein